MKKQSLILSLLLCLATALSAAALAEDLLIEALPEALTEEAPQPEGALELLPEEALELPPAQVPDIGPETPPVRPNIYPMGTRVDLDVFPDRTLVNYIIMYVMDCDEYLTQEKCDLWKHLNVACMNIETFEGIEVFTNLERLDCFSTLITQLDVSHNRKLKRLDCQNNSTLTQLDLGANPSLEELNCYSCPLDGLDLTGCSGLRYLDCDYDTLTALDVSPCPALITLNCKNNALTALDVTHCGELQYLHVSKNPLTSLKLTGLSALSVLYCTDTPLKTLDITGCDRLIALVKDTTPSLWTDSVMWGSSDYYMSIDRSLTLTAGGQVLYRPTVDITTCECVVEDMVYTGKADKPRVTLTDGTRTLQEDVDYTFTWYIDPYFGNTSVTVTGIGDYEGSFSRYFKLLPAKLSDCKITIAKETWTGQPVVPRVTVSLGGKKLNQGYDYTLTGLKNNKKVGKATVTIKGQGCLTGTVKKTFNILPQKITTIDLVGGKKRFTASWNKVKGGITGYQLQYSLKRNFAKAKTVTIKKAATRKKTVKGLKNDRLYYVRVRPYKALSNGKKLYGPWISMSVWTD